MVETIEKRIKQNKMNFKSLTHIIFNSCKYSFDFNVNYILEPKVIRFYFVDHIIRMDMYDLHILWMAMWDWPELFEDANNLQNYMIDRVFKEILVNFDENKFLKT